jgi:hypothetical protein
MAGCAGVERAADQATSPASKTAVGDKDGFVFMMVCLVDGYVCVKGGLLPI